MSKKSPTQIELEHKVRELEKELEQSRRKLKRALRQLVKYEDVDLCNQVLQADETVEEIEAEVLTKKETAKREAAKKEADKYFELTLPNGTIKKIKKRVQEE